MCQSSRLRSSLWTTAFLAGAVLCVLNSPALAQEARPDAAPTVQADGQATADAPAGHQPASEPAGSEHAGPDYNQPPLNFDATMFVFTLVVFGGFVALSRSLVWQPLINGLSSREGRIAQAEADAQTAQAEVRQLADQAEQRLAEVHQQVAAIMAQARADAEARKTAILAEAEASAQRMKQEALAAIAQARAEALTTLEQVADQQAGLATEQLSGVRL
jgi:F-type H+-transporting ATPase subunit b